MPGIVHACLAYLRLLGSSKVLIMALPVCCCASTCSESVWLCGVLGWKAYCQSPEQQGDLAGMHTRCMRPAPSVWDSLRQHTSERPNIQLLESQDARGCSCQHTAFSLASRPGACLDQCLMCTLSPCRAVLRLRGCVAAYLPTSLVLLLAGKSGQGCSHGAAHARRPQCRAPATQSCCSPG